MHSSNITFSQTTMGSLDLFQFCTGQEFNFNTITQQILYRSWFKGRLMITSHSRTNFR